VITQIKNNKSPGCDEISDNMIKADRLIGLNGDIRSYKKLD
jgi:hypothetical protein